MPLVKPPIPDDSLAPFDGVVWIVSMAVFFVAFHRAMWLSAEPRRRAEGGG